MKNLGFIGMGHMASALASGFLSAGCIERKRVYAYAPHQDKLKKNAEQIGFTPTESLGDLVDQCDTLLMACKPYQIETVLQEIGGRLKNKTLISIAAGWDFTAYGRFLDPSVHFQFVMPNTPAMVKEGVFLFEKANSLDRTEHDEIQKLFAALGVVIELPSSLMGIGGAITGCGPAFVDLFMEAYADAAVKYGVSREAAYQMVAQTVLGSARLMQKTGKHPGVLKDEVCSPGGTTIRGVASLEKNAFRSACIESIDAIVGGTK